MAQAVLEWFKDNSQAVKELAAKTDPNNDKDDLDRLKTMSLDDLNIMRIACTVEMALRIKEAAKEAATRENGN